MCQYKFPVVEPFDAKFKQFNLFPSIIVRCQDISPEFL